MLCPHADMCEVTQLRAAADVLKTCAEGDSAGEVSTEARGGDCLFEFRAPSNCLQPDCVRAWAGLAAWAHDGQAGGCECRSDEECRI